MKCNCGGEMRPTEVDFFGRWGNGPRVLITGVPAWKCQRCGEETVDSQTAARIQEILRAGTDRRVEPLHVREYAHADA